VEPPLEVKLDNSQLAERDDPKHDENDNAGKFVAISISTTAGFFPAEGFNRLPAHQPVKVELERARSKLEIRDVAGWIATVAGPAGKRVIDPEKSYAENSLSGEVEIDWGPSEGGGG
jgi:hypothetical protein